MTMTLNRGFWRPLSIIPMDNMLAWYSADSGNITKGYINKAQTATGTSGASSFLTSADISADLFPNMLVRLNGTDIYTIASVSGTTVNVTSALTANYVASAFAVEGISQWNDISGNNNHITQGTNSRMAGYVPSAVNGYSAVSFFGGQDFACPAGLYNNIGSSGLTIFASAIANAQVQATYLFSGTSDGADTPSLGYTSDTTGGLKFTHDLTGIKTSQLTTITNWGIVRGRRNGTTQATTYNNAAETTATEAEDLAALTTAWIGSYNNGGFPLDARVMDIIIYNASLSVPNIAIVEQYMAAKCGATLN